jgi:hypothetical protein
MEVAMTDKITAALAAVLVLGSAIAASAQPTVHASRMRGFTPGVQVYQSEVPLRGNDQYCYLPSEPCDNDHTVTN